MSEIKTIEITINGVVHKVNEGERLITAAEKAGEYIPRFCHHDKLEPVGKCRMCLVEVEGPRGKALMTSCTMNVSDGMVIDTTSQVVKRAQEGILEFLLLNHPLDCPVCDKGGECPLQDQALAYGAGESRFIEEKRRYVKPLPVSDIVLLDRERCVLCDRCVRVADDIAGDPLIEFINRGSHVQINTFPDLPFSSYFSGNTVQACPVGALTSVDYRFKARPWDLASVRSASNVDTMQSSVEVHSSRGSVVRVYGAENNELNEGWLSDKERFGFSVLRSKERITTPLIREGDSLREATWVEAIEFVSERLGSYEGTEVGAIGGANDTNEGAFALGKFMRTVICSPHIDAFVGDGIDPHLGAAVTPRAAVNDLDTADTILLWGPDLKEVLPVLYLRVRKAVRNGASLVVVSPYTTGLDSIASHVLRYRAGSGSKVLDGLRESLSASGGAGIYNGVVKALSLGPVVALFGRTSITEDPALSGAVAAFARELPDAKLMPLLTRANTFGALDMGLAPTLLPGRVSTMDEVASGAIKEKWGVLPSGRGMGTMEMLESLAEKRLRAVMLVGADPIRECPDPDLAERALDIADLVISIDAFQTDSTAKADVVLPVAIWGEVNGTVTNLEGRVQRVTRSVRPRGSSMVLTEVLDALARSMKREMDVSNWEAANREISKIAPAYAGMTSDYLTFEAGPDGAVVPLTGAVQPIGHIPTRIDVPVVEDRFTLHFAPSLYDAGVLTRYSETLSGLTPQPFVLMNPKDAESLNLAEGDDVEVEGCDLTLSIDHDVTEGSIVLPHNHESTRKIAATCGVSVSKSGGEK